MPDQTDQTEPTPPEPVVTDIVQISETLYSATIDGIALKIPAAPGNRDWELIRGQLPVVA